MRILLTYITLLLGAFAAFAQNRADTVKVFFRVGSSQLDPSYSDNDRVLQRFDAALLRAMANGAVDSVVVRGYASPEGMSDINERLSVLRTEAVADYIVGHAGIRPSLIRAHAEGVAWDELRDLVAADPDVPYRTKILNILDNVPLWIRGASGDIVDGRKKRLMDLDKGETYRWLLKNIFPKLRNAVAIAIYYSPEANSEEIFEKIEISETSRMEEILEQSELSDQSELSEQSEQSELSEKSDISDQSEHSEQSELSEKSEQSVLSGKSEHSERGGSFLMAIKTNMLYDAALVPNLGAEFSLGSRMSVYGEWMYAWWDNDPRHRYWRVYGGDLGLRWWFGRKAKTRRLSGHHLGVYGGILTFDFEAGDYGYMGGKPGGTLWDRYLVNAGVEYGFSLPVAKRLNIDFSIGVGYLGGNYYKYYPFDNEYYIQKEYKMHYFGPTKAEVSLVWLIGPGRFISGKGGER